MPDLNSVPPSPHIPAAGSSAADPSSSSPPIAPSPHPTGRISSFIRSMTHPHPRPPTPPPELHHSQSQDHVYLRRERPASFVLTTDPSWSSGPVPPVGDNTGVGSGPGPARLPRPITAADIYTSFEREQEATINRLSREVTALGSSPFIFHGVPSAPTANDKPNANTPSPSRPRQPRHSQSNPSNFASQATSTQTNASFRAATTTSNRPAQPRSSLMATVAPNQTSQPIRIQSNASSRENTIAPRRARTPTGARANISFRPGTPPPECVNIDPIPFSHYKSTFPSTSHDSPPGSPMARAQAGNTPPPYYRGNQTDPEIPGYGGPTPPPLSTSFESYTLSPTAPQQSASYFPSSTRQQQQQSPSRPPTAPSSYTVAPSLDLYARDRTTARRRQSSTESLALTSSTAARRHQSSTESLALASSTAARRHQSSTESLALASSTTARRNQYSSESLSLASSTTARRNQYSSESLSLASSTAAHRHQSSESLTTAPSTAVRRRRQSSPEPLARSTTATSATWSPRVLPVTPQYEETAQYRRALLAAKWENKRLRDRIRLLEAMIGPSGEGCPGEGNTKSGL